MLRVLADKLDGWHFFDPELLNPENSTQPEPRSRASSPSPFGLIAYTEALEPDALIAMASLSLFVSPGFMYQSHSGELWKTINGLNKNMV